MPRLCRARKTLPSIDGRASVMFTCNLTAGHDDAEPDSHREEGRVRTRSGQVSGYVFSWTDLGTEAWRQEATSPLPGVEELRDAVAGVTKLEDDIP